MTDQHAVYLTHVRDVLRRLATALESPRNLFVAHDIKREIDPWDALEVVVEECDRLQAAWLLEKSRADRLEGELSVLRPAVARYAAALDLIASAVPMETCEVAENFQRVARAALASEVPP